MGEKPTFHLLEVDESCAYRLVWILIQYSLWESSQAAGGKSYSTVGSFQQLATPGVLILRPVHTESPAVCQLQFRFSCPSTGSSGGLHL